MESVEDAIARLISALDAKDADAIAALVTDDAMLADEVTRGWLRGRENIRQALTTTFESVDSIASELVDLHVREVSISAVATCTLDQKYVPGGTPVAVVAPTSFSLERGDDGWRVVLMHSIPVTGD